MTVRLIAALAAVILLFASGAAYAFHDGGVASCKGCHVMHMSEDGLVSVDVTGALLQGESPSDVCLSCHAGPSGVFGPDPLGPPPELGAGNFAFQLEDEISDQTTGSGGGSGIVSVSGHRSGHSLHAPGHGLASDPEHVTAPGGTFPASQLGCTSCHDPHGNGNFRMLHDAGPVQDGLHVFISPAPTAEGLPVGVPGVEEGPTAHTAYQAGMSHWCANCHGQYHDLVGATDFEHPFDANFETSDVLRYEAYDGDANPSGGDPATSYLPEVPFETVGTTLTSTGGPNLSSKVSCLTCHRAHGSSAPAGLRWDARVFRLADDGALSGSYPIPSPYPDPNQRQLCLKCHDQDHAQNSNQACVVCHRRQPNPVSTEYFPSE